MCGGVYSAEATNPIVVKQKVVEFDDRYFFGVDGYYGVTDNFYQRKIIEDGQRYQEQIDDLKSELLKTQNQLLFQKTGKPVEEEVEIVEKAPIRLKKIEGDIDTTKLTEDEKYLYSNTYKLFKAKCLSCHGYNDDYGVNLIGKDSGGEYLNNTGTSVGLAAIIFHRVQGVGLEEGETRMPKGDSPLTDDEVQVFYQFLINKAKKEQ